MQYLKKSWLWCVIIGLICGAITIFILNRQKPVPVVYPVVATQPVGVDDVKIYGDYVGRIRAQQFVEIHARVEGYLEKMLFDEGTYIEKGQTLFQIDPVLYRARVKRAEAQLNKAKAQALKAERDLNRIRPLFELNAASQLDLDNAIANYEGANADVAVCEADMVQAQMTLDYTTVKSPISGYISERSVDIGALVGPGSQSLLATIVKSDTVKEKMELVERGCEGAWKAVLPILDDMERAVAASKKSDDVESLRQGEELVMKKFESVLQTAGITAIECVGMPFNEEEQEAVARFAAGEDKRGLVIDCVQRGYKLGERVLRYAKVVVGE